MLTRLLDVLSIMLLLSAVAAFVMGIRALEEAADLRALYLLIVGALALRSATDLLKPTGANR